MRDLALLRWLGWWAGLALWSAVAVARADAVAGETVVRDAGDLAETTTAPAETVPAPVEEAIPIDEAQEAALLREAGDGFAIKRTPHFVVAHDVPQALSDDLTQRLERTYSAIYRFCGHSRIDTHRPSRRLEVLFFNDRPDFDGFAATIGFPPENTYGVYNEPTNRSAFFNVATDPGMIELQQGVAAARANLEQMNQVLREIRGRRTVVEVEFADGRRVQFTRSQAAAEITSTRHRLARIEQRRENLIQYVNRSIIQHEIAHQVLHNAGVHVRGAKNPKWVVEGLAMMFETQPGAEGAGIAGVNQMRLQDFREAVAGGVPSAGLGPDHFLEAVAAGRLVPLERLLTDSSLFTERGEHGTADYALAWSLMHYLHRTRGEMLAAYLRELGQRRPGVPVSSADELALFERHFGPPDESLTRRWSSFILGLAVRSTSYR